MKPLQTITGDRDSQAGGSFSPPATLPAIDEDGIPSSAERPGILTPHATTLAPTRDLHVAAFQVCCAVLCLHILVDSYLELRPGTSPADHLVSGTVPIAVLVAATVLVRRLRAGALAAIALVLGLSVAIGAAGAPVSGLLAGRIDAATVSGAAALIAGLVLIGIGAMSLWTSRRSDGGRLRRWGRRAARGALGIALAVSVSLPVGMGYSIANRPNVADADSDLGRPQENITFNTTDGLTLAGSYVPSRSGAAVIVFPGRRSQHAKILADHGYGVLMFEPRGQGPSDGDPNLFGWSGEADLDAAIAYLQTRPDVDPDGIGGLGLSVGGELMIQTAAHNPDLRAVVSEGAGTRQVAEDLHMPAPNNIVGLPISATMTLATAVFSDTLPPEPLGSLIDDIAPRPVFLIWTRRGAGGEYNNPRYHHLAGDPKAIWEIPESSHTNGLDARPQEYERRLIAFFDGALLQPTR